MKSDLWAALLPIALIALTMHWIPLWRRQNLWFGVTVPTGFRETPQAKAVLRRYRIGVWAITLVTGALVSLLPLAILFQTFGCMAVFAWGRKRILPFSHPITVRSAGLAPDTEALPGGPVMAIGPFGILLATAFYLQANWQKIPDRFPIHFNLSGTPDGWANRSWRTVFAPVLIGIMLTLLLVIMGESILRYSPRSRASDTGDWTARFRRVNLRLLMVTTWGTTLMFSWFALAPLISNQTALNLGWLLPLALIASMAPFVWQLIQLSQEPGSGSDGTPDEAWKLGQFYYNPDDPALVVEKRFGVGYTINFGNRASWWLVALIAAPIVFVFFL